MATKKTPARAAKKAARKRGAYRVILSDNLDPSRSVAERKATDSAALVRLINLVYAAVVQASEEERDLSLRGVVWKLRAPKPFASLDVTTRRPKRGGTRLSMQLKREG